MTIHNELSVDQLKLLGAAAQAVGQRIIPGLPYIKRDTVVACAPDGNTSVRAEVTGNRIGGSFRITVEDTGTEQTAAPLNGVFKFGGRHVVITDPVEDTDRDEHTRRAEHIQGILTTARAAAKAFGTRS